MMNFKKIAITFVTTSLFVACSTTKKTTLWVSGYKSTCYSGAGKTNCLLVSKEKDLNKPNWVNFYAPIQGFEFEKGYLKKIKVKEKHLNPKNVPQDALSIQYTFIEELEKHKDFRLLANGNWLLTSINNHPINKMVKLPTLNIDIKNGTISGNSGCNQYFGKITKITPTTLNINKVGSTKMACIKKNIETDFLFALNNINTYQIKSNILNFYNDKGEKVLSFIKAENNKPNTRLHDIWAVTRINETPLNKMVSVPRLEINLSSMRIMGNDGCNDFSGNIKTATKSTLNFSNIILTKKMCLKAGVEAEFNKALNKVETYNLNGLQLILKDKNGKEILSLLKVD